ncbi:coenzyme F420-0:L-glutamate ligase [Methanoplanus endosymbiosus]|uniref:Coenzyme F420-0:L-glutamate ligase n=1 Tax=Methanoplanus endosymbiosus TaxID=33865 RepID=A0A9E7TL61_9EURY|nr:coenzyme F420-0:L-glutamate ligase [Methanoplanus endosymbiosus]UUX93479.1 coenzyme F420-0:L-glutamate ligase [Methanoplanus endosymbiosus]
MNSSYTVFGIKTGIIIPGDNITDTILNSLKYPDSLKDGDIIVIAESALASSEGCIIELSDVNPTDEALILSRRYNTDPKLTEVVLRESDSVVGGIPGFLLCMKNGTLLPNAGVDGSNAPDGTVVTLPKNPDRSAERIHHEIFEKTGIRAGIIIADSRTHAMRLGCSGVAIGCYGITAVSDEKGREDLFGRALEVTELAIADNIASAAELVMGEADESTPVAIIRGLGLEINNDIGVQSIEPSGCLFMGVAMNSNPSLFN